MPAPFPYAHPHQHYAPNNNPSVVVVPTHPGWQAAPPSSSSSSSSGSGSGSDSDSDEERGGRCGRSDRAEYGRLKPKSRRKSRR